MTTEGSRWGKLTQLVTHHVFGDEYLQVISAIVHHEREADEFGYDRAVASPRGDRRLVAAVDLLVHFREQPDVNIRAFFK